MIMKYRYVEDPPFEKKFKSICKEAIAFVQRKMRSYLTFTVTLIGSGSRNMLMLNGKSKKVDLDFNFNIQRDKNNLLNNPFELKRIAINAFKAYFKECDDVAVKNSKSAITIYLGEISKYICSFDCAFIVEGNDGYYHKLIFDKNFQRYIWNRMPHSQDHFAKYEWLKHHNYIDKIEDLYKTKKDVLNDESSTIFIKTINELYMKYGQK